MASGMIGCGVFEVGLSRCWCVSSWLLCGYGLLRLTCVDNASLGACPFWATCRGSGVGRGRDELPGLADLPRFFIFGR